MISRISAGIFLSLSLLLPFAAHAEVIRSFDVTATLTPDRRVVFEEAIDYDFEELDRHGIFRFIPEKTFRNGATYRYRYEVLSVTRDGNDEPYEQSRDGGNIMLKIGDGDITITGPHLYRIRYATDRAITSFEDHDELYWNVTGDQWPVPIEQSSITFLPPAGATVTSSTCFTGAYGSTEQACGVVRSAEGVKMASTRVLSEYEGFTAAFAFPKGIVRELTTWDWIWMIVQDNGVLFFPIAAFLIMFQRWWSKGRDPKLQSVIAQYEPPEYLPPAVMGGAMKEGGAPPQAVTATIIDLARRGYLHIRFGEKKTLFRTKQTFTFVKTPQQERREETTGQKPFESAIYYGLFKGGDEQSIDDLKEAKFYEAIGSFRQEVQKVVDGMKLFDANPAAVRGAYIAVAVTVPFLLSFFFLSEPIGVLALGLTGAIIFVFGWFMPRRTAEGRKKLEEILGFKLFLSVTEKDRASFHNAPERKPEQFQEYLPYAILFGVEEQWAEQFKDIQIEPPEWAEGVPSSNFSAAYLVSSLDSMHSFASASAYSTPSSGGSGFSGGGSSGGGGGGGGGGSW